MSLGTKIIWKILIFELLMQYGKSDRIVFNKIRITDNQKPENITSANVSFISVGQEYCRGVAWL